MTNRSPGRPVFLHHPGSRMSPATAKLNKQSSRHTHSNLWPSIQAPHPTNPSTVPKHHGKITLTQNSSIAPIPPNLSPTLPPLTPPPIPLPPLSPPPAPPHSLPPPHLLLSLPPLISSSNTPNMPLFPPHLPALTRGSSSLHSPFNLKAQTPSASHQSTLSQFFSYPPPENASPSSQTASQPCLPPMPPSSHLIHTEPWLNIS
jgi:hypothetical protein